MGPPLGGPEAPEQVAACLEMTPKSAPTVASDGSPGTTSERQTASFDPVEGALSLALEEAAKAGRFDVVVQLARDLEARRLAGAPHVVPANVVPIGRPKRG